MLSTNQPSRLPIPFANGAGAGFIRPIPTASQIGTLNGAASLTDGFPPLCLTPETSGGVPPFGQDINGVLNWLSSINQWYQAGGPVTFNATFAAAIGGYPKGAVLQSATLGGLFWRSITDSNLNDPDANPTGWVSLFAPVFVGPTFTGTTTFNGPVVVGAGQTVNLNNAASATTQGQGDNSTKVATTAYADAAAAARAGHADAITQSNPTFSASQTLTASLSYTPPVNGYLLVHGVANFSGALPGSVQMDVIVNAGSVASEHTANPMYIPWALSVTGGVALTISTRLVADAWSSGNIGASARLGYVFVPG